MDHMSHHLVDGKREASRLLAAHANGSTLSRDGSTSLLRSDGPFLAASSSPSLAPLLHCPSSALHQW